MSVRRIIFWQPFASPHQEAFLEAVAEQFSGEVILGVERPNLPPDRVAQGWREPKHVRVRVIDISKPENHAALSAYRSPESLHVFTGFFSHPLVWAGFHELVVSEAGLAIYSEAPEQPWQTGWLKRLRGRWLARRWGHRFAFVLAVGGIGCNFFERIGFPKEKIVPFGYYFAVASVAAEPSLANDGIFRFISAGQLVFRKGIDILIKACRSLPKSGWCLDIYGDGPERQALERLATRLQLISRITFHGTVPSDVLKQRLAAADCAVVPSRFDGWGALVNEAMAVGTPIICTKRCGAALLGEQASGGGKSPKANAGQLGRAMRHALNVGIVDQHARAERRKAAFAGLSAASAASRALALIRSSNS